MNKKSAEKMFLSVMLATLFAAVPMAADVDPTSIKYWLLMGLSALIALVAAATVYSFTISKKG